MNETEEQRHARWSREREIDKVAIPLGRLAWPVAEIRKQLGVAA